MGRFYKEFTRREIESRKSIIEDRKIIVERQLDIKLPSFIQEKMNEIKLMALMGFDNFVMKCLALFIEEILLHILIASEIETEDEYIKLLKENKKKYGHQFLKEINNKGLIHKDDYEFCSRFLNDEVHGGETIRNIEIHNLLADKIHKFKLRDEIIESINDDGAVSFLESQIKTKPNYVHIGARDMVSRNILNEIAHLYDLLNRNAEILSVLNNLPDGHTSQIIKNLPTGKTFVLIVDEVVSKKYDIKSDIKKLGDVISIEESFENDDTSHKRVCRYLFVTADIHSAMDIIINLTNCINNNYSFISIGLYR